MITFISCLAILIIGYFVYGTYVDKNAKLSDDNQTPAVRLEDGVDYMPMPWYKVFLIQFLNIAGTGPIFGAIMGALFGPVAFLWITFGTIFAGGVHDYLSGVISMKHDGTSVSEIVGIYLGDGMKKVMRVFYGAMVVEGIVALIWCAVTIAFFGESGVIQSALDSFGGQSGVVSHISKELLGPIGAVLAVLGVVACPITSGDTAFRSARLTIADAFNIKQDGLLSRFKLAIPLFAVCVFLTTIDFNIIWRYFAWSNQTLATIFLWTATVYLIKNEANYWISLIPATFMSSVCVSYILQAPEGFRLNAMFSNGVGVVAAIVLFVLFMLNKNKFVKNKDSKNIA